MITSWEKIKNHKNHKIAKNSLSTQRVPFERSNPFDLQLSKTDFLDFLDLVSSRKILGTYMSSLVTLNLTKTWVFTCFSTFLVMIKAWTCGLDKVGVLRLDFWIEMNCFGQRSVNVGLIELWFGWRGVDMELDDQFRHDQVGLVDCGWIGWRWWDVWTENGFLEREWVIFQLVTPEQWMKGWFIERMRRKCWFWFLKAN